jgi:rubredoxin
MSLSTLQILILLAAQVVTCIALLQVRLLNGPMQLAAWPARANLEALRLLDQMAPEAPAAAPQPVGAAVTPAAPALPPSQPVDWAARDQEIGRVVRLNPTPGAPFRAATPCGCGGAWRYMVSGTDADPVWRCLHCGNLYAGESLIPQSPTAPEAWAAQDRELGGILLLKEAPSVPFADGERCSCGGAWRYVLGGSAGDPVWRCLHCGHVFVGRDAIPWS